MEKKFDIGLIGIAVMGENLALNMASKGFDVMVNARKQETVDAFLNGRAQGKSIGGTANLATLVDTLKSPRKIMLMVKAGNAVDEVIDRLIPLLSKGDVIIDGGNSLFTDTTRRTHYCASNGLYFIGTGVSGGEEGALNGPSIMPGGAVEAWPLVKPILQGIAARVSDGSICCDWVGPEGAGHFVKMVHNGIEYGDIQLITEIYFIMKKSLGLSNDEMADIFDDWNKGELESYLIEITANILRYKDSDNTSLIDKILDTAGQKGTGKWTVNASLESGVPLTLIAESVFARFLSSLKDERVVAAKRFPKASGTYQGDKAEMISALRQALYAAKLMSYAQGYALMRSSAKEFGWDLNYGGIALMWRGGCIIRSAFLGKIKEAFDANPELPNLMMDPYFEGVIKSVIPDLRKVVSESALTGIPAPTLFAALSYFDGYTTASLPANLLQAQRDYFGAHTYERVDQPRGEFFHTNWTGHGGTTSSTTYNV
jgi:6-phosphogluconate dehydrogenase